MKVGKSENVVRVLFPNKVFNGRVLGGAFVLRGHREEKSISVFRTVGPTFAIELRALDRERNLPCAQMSVGEIEDVKFTSTDKSAWCVVSATCDITSSAHAGIEIYVNAQQVIGSHEDEIVLCNEIGVSMDVISLALQHRLAVIAQRGLTRVNNLILAEFEQIKRL